MTLACLLVLSALHLGQSGPPWLFALSLTGTVGGARAYLDQFPRLSAADARERAGEGGRLHPLFGRNKVETA